ncbi:MAG: hypothetical protein M1138_06350 [Candidatus Thermoplasmatota archaeon]|nr:hypothetical protein [Candidatus Thermoplasmatota archaeon]
MFFRKKETEVNGWILGFDQYDELVQIYLLHQKVEDPKVVKKWFKEKRIWNFTDDDEFYPIAVNVEMDGKKYKWVKQSFIEEARPYLD